MKTHEAEVFLTVEPVPLHLVPVSRKVDRQLKWLRKRAYWLTVGMLTGLVAVEVYEIVLNHILIDR